MKATRKTVRAAVLTGPGAVEIQSFAAPECDDETAILDVELCGICGTDLKYFEGRLAAPYPMVPGHEIVGRIASVGEVAAQRYGVAVGDRVVLESSIPCWSCSACRSGAYRLCPTKGGYGTRLAATVGPGLWGGLAEQVVVARGSIVHRLDARVTPEQAIGIPLLANGFAWLVRAGGMVAGDRVLIQGCGPQGLAAALVARRSGAREVVVTGLPQDAARLRFAERCGARTVTVYPTGPQVEDNGMGYDYDIVLDVSGSPVAIAGAAARLRPQGTFVLAGLVGRGVSAAIATDELVWREIRLQGVLSKDDAAMRAAQAVVESDPALAALVAEMLTDIYPLDAAAAAITAGKAGIEGFVKAAVRPASATPSRGS